MNAISKGHVVNFAWLWTKARKLQTEIYPTVEIKHHVREKCIRTGANEPSYDDKCGRYKPTERLNVNQSALPFVVYGKRLTNMFHLVKALHIIHGFLNQEQDWRNVNAPCK